MNRPEAAVHMDQKRSQDGMRPAIEIVGDGVVELRSEVEGPTLGIVSNVHGDEPVGRAVARWLANEMQPRIGAIRLFDANRDAYFLRRRFVDRDLNRLFVDEVLNEEEQSLELLRAKYLIPLLLECDYVLDMHSTSTPSGEPFVLSWPGSEKLAEMVRVAKTYGWQGVVEGTMVEYLSARNVPAIALEAGEHEDAYSETVAKYVVAEVLDGLGICPLSMSRPAAIQASKSRYKVVGKYSVHDPASYHFTERFGAFDAVAPRAVIGRDDLGEYLAPALSNLRILMPASITSIRTGQNPDAFFLIQEIDAD